jgi:hypothetical protein
MLHLRFNRANQRHIRHGDFRGVSIRKERFEILSGLNYVNRVQLSETFAQHGREIDDGGQPWDITLDHGGSRPGDPPDPGLVIEPTGDGYDCAPGEFTGGSLHSDFRRYKLGDVPAGSFYILSEEDGRIRDTHRLGSNGSAADIELSILEGRARRAFASDDHVRTEALPESLGHDRISQCPHEFLRL